MDRLASYQRRTNTQTCWEMFRQVVYLAVRNNSPAFSDAHTHKDTQVHRRSDKYLWQTVCSEVVCRCTASGLTRRKPDGHHTYSNTPQPERNYSIFSSHTSHKYVCVCVCVNSHCITKRKWKKEQWWTLKIQQVNCRSRKDYNNKVVGTLEGTESMYVRDFILQNLEFFL